MNEVEKAIRDNFPNYISIGVDLAKEKYYKSGCGKEFLKQNFSRVAQR